MKTYFGSNSIFINNLYLSINSTSITYPHIKKSLYEIIKDIEGIGSCNYENYYKNMMDILINNPYKSYYINNGLFIRIDIYLQNVDFYILIEKRISFNIFDKYYILFKNLTNTIMKECIGSIVSRPSVIEKKLTHDFYFFDGIACIIYILEINYIPDHFLDLVHIYKIIVENQILDTTELFFIYLQHIKNKINIDLIKKTIDHLYKDKLSRLILLKIKCYKYLILINIKFFKYII